MSDYEKAIYNKGYTDGCHYGYSVGVAKPGYELKNTVEKRKKELYFLKQRIIGFFVVVFSIIACITIDDCTFAVFTIPLGLWMVLGNTMLIANRYYFEVMEARRKHSL